MPKLARILALGLALLAGGAASAQAPAGPPPGGQPGQGLTDAQRAQFAKYQPVFDLQSTVNLLADLEGQKGLAFSKTQAKTLLPILKNLQTRADLKPADAEKILVNIEDKVLTVAQLKWLDTAILKREEEARRRAAARAGGGGTGGGAAFVRPPGGNAQGGANRPAGAGGPGGGRAGLFQAIQQGTPFNPFKEGPPATRLAEFVTVLSKK